MSHFAKSSWITKFNIFQLGIVLGIIFVKTEVARWDRIYDMFCFKEPRMYLIITTAIVVAGVSMRLLKSFGVKNLEGEKIRYKPKPFHKGVIPGGLCFGMGWAMTGACPGPIYAQVGAGEFMALFTLAGAIVGMYLYAALKPRLPH